MLILFDIFIYIDLQQKDEEGSYEPKDKKERLQKMGNKECYRFGEGTGSKK